MSGPDPLDEPRAAVERGDWQQALDLLDAGGSEASSAEGLELRARAAYGNGEFEAAVSRGKTCTRVSSRKATTSRRRGLRR